VLSAECSPLRCHFHCLSAAADRITVRHRKAAATGSLMADRVALANSSCRSIPAVDNPRLNPQWRLSHTSNPTADLSVEASHLNSQFSTGVQDA